jgi:predicted RNA-binding Zn ribbon-like protein
MKFNPSFFVGGVDCIDFCNTVDHRHSPPACDFLQDAATAVEWGKAAGILSKSEGLPAGRERRSFADLLSARAELSRVLLPFARGGRPTDADLQAFSDRLQKVSLWLRLASRKGRYQLEDSSDDPLDKIRTAVIRSAADLLLSGSPERIRECGECGWMFYDTSRNHLRRWCSMEICGNRAKARRHYERVKRGKRQAVRSGAGARSSRA